MKKSLIALGIAMLSYQAVGANSGWPGIAQTGWPPRKTGKHRPWPVLPALYALVDDLVG
jgi:hypothetical protein